jgi:cobalt-zinc-cadmium efflux system membrane fusion protein
MSKRNYVLAGVLVVTLTLAGLWWFTRSGTAPPVTEKLPRQSAQAAPGILSIEDRQAAQLGIRLAPATAAGEAPLATIPATIQPPANARVAVAATFPGVVMRTLVVEGDSVRQGQPLTIISSREVLTMGADLTRASARLGVARSSAARLSQLSREGIIAGARADDGSAGSELPIFGWNCCESPGISLETQITCRSPPSRHEYRLRARTSHTPPICPTTRNDG